MSDYFQNLTSPSGTEEMENEEKGEIIATNRGRERKRRQRGRGRGWRRGGYMHGEEGGEEEEDNHVHTLKL